MTSKKCLVINLKRRNNSSERLSNVKKQCQQQQPIGSEKTLHDTEPPNTTSILRKISPSSYPDIQCESAGI